MQKATATAASTDAGRAEVAVPLRKNRDYLLLWCGQAVSTLGSEISYVAYPLLVLAMTGSAAKAGLVGFFSTLPWFLITLPAGVAADRWNRKRAMIACDVGRAIALGSLGIAYLLHRLSFEQIVLVAFVEGALTVLFFVCERPAIRRVVAHDQLSEAVARNEARDHAASLAGPGLGGVLFALGRGIPFLVDAFTYLGSLATLLLIRAQFDTEVRPPRLRFWAEIAEAFRWLWRRPFLRGCSLIMAGSNPIVNGVILVVIVLARDQGFSGGAIGAMLAVASAGGVIGALVAPWIQRRVPMHVVVLAEPWVKAACLPLLVLAPNPYLLGAIFAVPLAYGPLWEATVVGYRLSVVPDAMQGRVQGVSTLVSWSTVPLGALFAGVLIEAVGARATALGLAGWAALIGLVATSSRTMRRGRD